MEVERVLLEAGYYTGFSMAMAGMINIGADVVNVNQFVRLGTLPKC